MKYYLTTVVNLEALRTQDNETLVHPVIIKVLTNFTNYLLHLQQLDKRSFDDGSDLVVNS